MAANKMRDVPFYPFNNAQLFSEIWGLRPYVIGQPVYNFQWEDLAQRYERGTPYRFTDYDNVPVEPVSAPMIDETKGN